MWGMLSLPVVYAQLPGEEAGERSLSLVVRQKLDVIEQRLNKMDETLDLLIKGQEELKTKMEEDHKQIRYFVRRY